MWEYSLDLSLDSDFSAGPSSKFHSSKLFLILSSRFQFEAMKVAKYFAFAKKNSETSAVNSLENPAVKSLENPFLSYLCEEKTSKTEFIPSRSCESHNRRLRRSAHVKLEIASEYTPTESSTSSSSPSSSPYSRSGSSSSADAEYEAVVEAFKIIDRNGDGKISLHDLDLMWRSMGKKLSKKDLRLMLQDADKDGDGELNLEEFISIHRETVGDSNDYAHEIRVAFNLVDADRNNYISAQELQRVMKRLGNGKTTLAECNAMIKSVDSHGNGQLHFEDFDRLMRSSSINAY